MFKNIICKTEKLTRKGLVRGFYTTKTKIPPLVSPKWLHENLNSKNIKIIDASWHMPSSKRNGYEEYLKEHIPNARFFDLDKISDTSTNLPHMMPSNAQFEDYLNGELGGISNNDDMVVIYDSVGIFSAPRVWYTFKAFGINNVSVLNGGLPIWKQNGYPVQSGNSKSQSKKSSNDAFRPKLNKESIVDIDEMKSIVNNSKEKVQVLDARSESRFNGDEPDPRAHLGVKPGHMPNATCLPFKLLLNNYEYKSTQQLIDVFKNKNININKPIVTTCGSGITAAIISFALHLIQYENSQNAKSPLRLYDGSWAEWGSRSDTIIQTAKK